MNRPDHHLPVNPIPPVVLVLFAAIVGIEVIFQLGTRGIIGGPGAVGWRLASVQSYAVSADLFQWMWANRQFPAEHVMRLVTYLFVHGNFTHALFAGVMTLALGKMVNEAFSSIATLVVFFASGILGALVFAVVASGPQPLIGAFPGVYGLIGAFTYLIWVRLKQVGARQARAFSLIGVLLLLQLVFGLLFGGQSDWIADVAGFVFGFGMSFVLVPGGWSKIRARIRHE